MDKYLAPNQPSSSGVAKSATMDLLSMMKNTSSVQRNDQNLPGLALDSVSINSGWTQREQKVNLTTIKCNERSKSMNTDIRGWRVVDGQKTYTTFRNGKVVSASGFEGFKLSSGDKPKTKVVEASSEEQKVGLKRKANGTKDTTQHSGTHSGPNSGPKQQKLRW